LKRLNDARHRPSETAGHHCRLAGFDITEQEMGLVKNDWQRAGEWAGGWSDDARIDLYKQDGKRISFATCLRHPSEV
jgi:hypothetical protein